MMDPLSPQEDSPNETTRLSQTSFVPDPTIGGWVCPHCMMTPYQFRAPGSFSVRPPTIEYANEHFANCFGLIKLCNLNEQGNASTSSSYLQSCESPTYDIPPASCESSLGLKKQGSATNQSTSFPQLREISSHSSWSSRPDPNIGLYNPQSLTNAAAKDASNFTLLHSLTSPSISSMSHQIHQDPHRQRPQLEFKDIAAQEKPPSVVQKLNNAQAAAKYLASESSARASLQLEKEEALVLTDDRQIATDYIYYLFQQLRICHFLEADRKTRGGKRDKITIGYGGLECLHCAGDGKSRKFFWRKADQLGNSLTELSGHVMKCQKCPVKTKEALRELKLCHLEQMALRPRGSQKLFFRRVWRRIHGNDDNTETVPSGSLAAANSAYSPSSLRKGCSDEKRKIGKEHEIQAGSSAAILPIRLAVSSDVQWLSDLECSVRSSLEVFCASQADVVASHIAQSYPIRLNQVGLRCIYCASTSGVEDDGAVMFPRSINDIYDSVQEFHRSHLCHCRNVPPNEADKLSRMEKPTRAFVRISRRHYMASAKSLGLYDTSDGIFMLAPISKTGGSIALTSARNLQHGGQESPCEGEESIASVECFGEIAAPSQESRTHEFNEGQSPYESIDNAKLNDETSSFPNVGVDDHMAQTLRSTQTTDIEIDEFTAKRRRVLE